MPPAGPYKHPSQTAERPIGVSIYGCFGKPVITLLNVPALVKITLTKVISTIFLHFQIVIVPLRTAELIIHLDVIFSGVNVPVKDVKLVYLSN